MTDTYNDTTGSRKKFLIPLVVLLLCAVSLTGAGYAYNSSVTVNNQGSDVDDHFAIDLYTFADPTVVEDFADLSTYGIVFTTHKVAGTSLTGDFELEAVDAVTIYKGTFKVNAQDMDDTTTGAKVKLDGFNVAFADGTIYKAADVVGGAITAEMQVAADEDFTVMKTFGVDTFTYNTPYYYRIVVTAISGTVAAKDNVDPSCNDATAKDAAAFARNVIDATKGVEIQFGFTLTAYNANTFTVTYYNVDNGGAPVATGAVDLYTTGTAFALGVPADRDGLTFGGWFASEDCSGDAITSIAANATVAQNVYAKWTTA